MNVRFLSSFAFFLTSMYIFETATVRITFGFRITTSFPLCEIYLFHVIILLHVKLRQQKNKLQPESIKGRESRSCSLTFYRNNQS